MGTWAVDEREAELCELIADQDERWDEALKGKEQWINKPAQPPGLLRSGTFPAATHSCLAVWAKAVQNRHRSSRLKASAEGTAAAVEACRVWFVYLAGDCLPVL